MATIAIAAPAIAASASCTPQTAVQIQTALQFTSGIGAWAQTRTPTSAPAVEFSSNYNGLTNVALVVADPPNNTATDTVLASPFICLGPGTYTFTFNSRLYNANARVLRLRADVVDQANAQTISNTVDFSTTTGAVSSRTGDVVTVTVSQRTQVRFRYRWTFTSGTGFGDDIGVSAPTVTRTG